MKTTSSKATRVSDQTIVTDLAGKIFSASRGNTSVIIAFFYYILKFLLSVGAFIPRVFLRSKLGERTFGIITIIFVYVFLSIVQLSKNLISANWEEIRPIVQEAQEIGWYDIFGTLILILSLPDRNQMSEVGPILGWQFFREEVINYHGLTSGLMFCWWIVLALSVLHFFELYKTRKNGEVVHSYHRGKSVFFFFFSGKKVSGVEIKNIHIWMVVEPIFMLLLAIVIDFSFNFHALSLVLKFSAIFLFLEEYRVYMENRSMVLDISDSLIDGGVLSQVQEKYTQKLATQETQNDSEEGVIGTINID